MTVFEQIQFTKKQLQDTRIMEFMNDLYEQTPNHYLKYRLESLLAGWRDIVHVVPTKKRKTQHPTSVFEAIIKDDDYFFETKSVPELLHRLLKSFDRNYKVTIFPGILTFIGIQFFEMNIILISIILTFNFFLILNAITKFQLHVYQIQYLLKIKRINFSSNTVR